MGRWRGFEASKKLNLDLSVEHFNELGMWGVVWGTDWRRVLHLKRPPDWSSKNLL